MTKTCQACNTTFDGRSHAKTCSARCRKRLQRLAQATGEAAEKIQVRTESFANKIADEIKQEAHAVEASLGHIAANQAGFAAIAEPLTPQAPTPLQLNPTIANIPQAPYQATPQTVATPIVPQASTPQPAPLAVPVSPGDSFPQQTTGVTPTPAQPTPQPIIQSAQPVPQPLPVIPAPQITSPQISVSDPLPPAESLESNTAPVGTQQLRQVASAENPALSQQNTQPGTGSTAPTGNAVFENQLQPTPEVRPRRRLFKVNKTLVKMAGVAAILTMMIGGWGLYIGDRTRPGITSVTKTIPEQTAKLTSDEVASLSGDFPYNQEQELLVQGDGTFTGNLSAANFKGNGSNITNLNASNITSGALNANRLPSNVTLLGNTIPFANLQGPVISSINNVSNNGGNIDLVAGNNIAITTNDGTNKITISTTGSSGGIASNSFATINAPSGTNPVADSATDTLNITASGSNLTVTGDSATDSLNFNIDETVLAGAGLTASGSGLNVGAGNGISVNANDIAVIYGISTNTAVEGNTVLNCPSGSGNLTGGGTAITLGAGGTCSALGTVSNPSFATSVTTPLLTSTGALTITPGGALTVGAAFQSTTLQGNSFSTFVINGVTVSASEFNLLDGHDVALVDTNDAVNTAITGTGALDSGSITANFGSIDTGSDSIATTGSVLGNSFDRSTSGALNFGNTNATSVSLCNSANCDTISIGTNADADTINIGDGSDTLNLTAATTNISGHTSGAADTFVISNSTSTGNVLVAKDNSTAVLTIADGGAATFQNSTNSATGFVVKNSGGTAVATVDTSGGSLKLGTASSLSGSLVFQNASGSGDITLVTSNPGSSSFTITLPNATGTVCLTSGNCSGVGGNGDILNNGQNGPVTIGTNDATTLSFETNNTNRLTITSAGSATYTGGSSGDALTISNSTSSGNVLVLKDNSTAVATVADGGVATFQNSADSTTGFQVLDADGGNPVLNIDTANERVGIGLNNPGYALDVNGDINLQSGNAFRIGGTAICTSGGCAAEAGSANYIQNSASLQAGANFYIESASINSVAGVIKGKSGQVSDLFQLQDGDGTGVVTFGATGDTLISPSADSATAFQVQNAGGGSVLNVDTIGNSVKIGQGGCCSGAATLTLDSGVEGAILNLFSGGGSGDNPLVVFSRDGGTTTISLTAEAINSNAIITLPDEDGTICLQSSSSCGFASGSGLAFIQNGNSFGANAILGTNDSNSLSFETNNAIQATIADGGMVTFQNSTDSTTGFQVMDADGGNPVFNVDTTNERVGIGTANPNYLLDIVGNDTSNGGNLRLKNYVSHGIGPRIILDNSGGYGEGSLDFYTIGGANPLTDNPSARWHAVDDGAYSANMFFETLSGSTLNTGLSILSNGNVGVGTASPTGKLSVIGPYSVGGSIPTSGQGKPNILSAGRLDVVNDNRAFYFDIATSPFSYAEFSTYKYDDSSTFPMIFQANGGNVGLGYTGSAPGSLLSVNGGISVGNGYYATAAPSNGLLVQGAILAPSLDADTTSTLSIGNTTATALSLCNSANCDTISIGTNTDADAINLGDASDTVIIDGASGTQQLFNSANVHTVQIASSSSAAQTVTIGATGSGSTITIQGGTGAGAIALTQGSNGTITIGGTGGASAVTVQCGTGNCNLGTGGTAHTTTVGSATGTATTNINGGTGGLNIGTSNVNNQTIQIGNTANAVAQTINIGNNATSSSTNTVTIGNLLSTSASTIQGGTGASAVSVQAGASGIISIGTTAVANTIAIGDSLDTLTLTGNSSSSFVLNGVTIDASEFNVLDGGVTEGEVSGVITDVTAGSGLTGGASSGNATVNVGAGNGITVNTDDIAVNLTTSGTTGSTSSNSGLEVGSGGLTLLKGCGDNSTLKYTDAGGWECATDLGSGTDVSARVYNTTNTTLANDTATALTFNSERYDTSSIHSTLSSTGRLTAPSAGKYLIEGYLNFASSATGGRGCTVKLNGTTSIGVQTFQAANGSSSSCTVSAVYSLAANDYVELVASQTSGGNLDVVANGNFSPEFSMHQLTGTDTTIDLDSAYGSDTNKTLNVNDTAGLSFDLTSTGDFVLKDNSTAFATFDDSGGITFAPNGTSDFTVSTDADTNFQITASAGNTTAFIVTNSSNKAVATVDTSGGKLVLGDLTSSGVTGALVFNTSNNANTVTLTSGATSTGYTLTLPTAAPGGNNYCLVSSTGGALSFLPCGAGSTATATLVAEYPGATLTGDGSNNTGTMTSDFCSGSSRQNVNTSVCTVSTESQNYYSWTANATNDYDIWVRWQVPSDFSSFSSASFNGWRTSSSDSVTASIYNNSASSCDSASISGTVATWNSTSWSSIGSCTPAAGDIITIRIQLSVGVNGEFARAGALSFTYNRK